MVFEDSFNFSNLRGNAILYKNESACYAIFCRLNSKYYIGSTCNLHSRLYDHSKLLKKGCHKNKDLQNDYNKFGDKEFLVYVLKLCKNENERIVEKQFLSLDNIVYYNTREVERYNVPILTCEQTVKFWNKFPIFNKKDCCVGQASVYFNPIVYESHIVSFVLNYREKNNLPEYQIPLGYVVRHICHNHRCMNPYHLDVGTESDNSWDNIRCDKHSSQKIPYKHVSRMRVFLKSGYLKTSNDVLRLADKYDVGVAAIVKILNNKTFKDENYLPPYRTPIINRNTKHSKYYGVYLITRKTNNSSVKWSAICNGSYLGKFCTEIEAATVYNDYVLTNNIDKPLNYIGV